MGNCGAADGCGDWNTVLWIGCYASTIHGRAVFSRCRQLRVLPSRIETHVAAARPRPLSVGLITTSLQVRCHSCLFVASRRHCVVPSASSSLKNRDEQPLSEFGATACKQRAEYSTRLPAFMPPLSYSSVAATPSHKRTHPSLHYIFYLRSCLDR